MRRITTLSSRRNDSGSTILELLAALLIISLLGMGAWHAAGVSLRMANRLRYSLAAGARLLQLDDHLRRCAGRIVPPYWAPDEIVQVSDAALTVPYLDGAVQKSLAISFENGVLRMGDGEHSIQYSGFRSVTFSEAAAGRCHYGVTLRLERTDGRVVTLTARFGGTPVGSAGSQ